LECRGKLAESAQELTERSYNRAHIVLLVIDATMVKDNGGMTRRELALATNVVGEGRALVVALNKLDALEDLERLEVM
jgi:predicted GTPase